MTDYDSMRAEFERRQKLLDGIAKCCIFGGLVLSSLFFGVAGCDVASGIFGGAAGAFLLCKD